MSLTNKNVTAIPAGVIEDATEKLAEIETLLAPYIVPLTTEEREQIPKTSDKSIAFVTNAFDYTTTNPEFVPNYMNTGEFKIDVDNYNALRPLLTQAMQLVNNLAIPR